MTEAGYSLDEWLNDKLKDPRFRRNYERYELPSRLAAEISLLRRKNGMTQAQLARKVRTCQEVISRLESAARPSVTMRTLERLAQAFGKRLEIRFL